MLEILHTHTHTQMWFWLTVLHCTHSTWQLSSHYSGDARRKKDKEQKEGERRERRTGRGDRGRGDRGRGRVSASALECGSCLQSVLCRAFSVFEERCSEGRKEKNRKKTISAHSFCQDFLSLYLCCWGPEREKRWENTKVKAQIWWTLLLCQELSDSFQKSGRSSCAGCGMMVHMSHMALMHYFDTLCRAVVYDWGQSHGGGVFFIYLFTILLCLWF